MKSFQGKVAAITGAGSGMGRGIAINLAKRGCHLSLSDVTEEALMETERLAASHGVNVYSHLVDVSDKAAVEKFASDTNEQHGKVNMIFNNAGVSVTDSVEHLGYDDFNWLMNINFWGVVYGTKAFLPYLQKADEAHIINTASIFGVIAVATQSAYNASKFAVRGFTESLAQELDGSQIGVSCVQPGGVKTNIVKFSRFHATDNMSTNREEMEANFEQLAGLTSEQAAEIIVAGVAKKKRRILVGKDAKILALITQFLPVRYYKLVARALDL